MSGWKQIVYKFFAFSRKLDDHFLVALSKFNLLIDFSRDFKFKSVFVGVFNGF
jgi:hypothetical protein